jgi:hypothetical protein
MEDFVYIVEVFECLGGDVGSYLDYSVMFETFDRCKEYCNKENSTSDDWCYLQPLKIGRKSYVENIQYEEELFNRI